MPPISYEDRAFLNDNPNTDDVVAWIHNYAQAYAAQQVAELTAAKAEPLTDEQIEDTVIKYGGKWDGDHWTFEDADLHPFFRSIYGIKGLT
jgi:hypothetical protein